ncbi:MAG: tetratricopeptide repeat protein [Crocinitomicaceae bacterium]|nr:tetratricopeptide repeat protein [Crocinitomicaceae bacterium]
MRTEELDVLSDAIWQKRLLDIQSAYQEGLEVLKQSEEQGYYKGIADSCKTLGYCYWRFSDFSLSLSNSLRALDIYRQLGDKGGEADTLNNVGAVYMFQNDNEKRLEVNIRCKELREEVGDMEGVTSSEGNIGETYLEMGDLENAEKCFHAVIEHPDASPQGIAWAYHNLGRIREQQKKWEGAYDFYRKGLTLSESTNYNVLITDSYLKITDLFILQNDLESALDYAESALDVSRRIGAKEGEKKSLYFLSKIYELKGMFETSLKYHKDYHTMDMEISHDTEMERLKTTQLKVAYDKIEEHKNELIGSIRYAKKIQTAVLTRDQNQELLEKYFVYFQPKDIVSGDFYWYYEKNNYFYICVADCTGHGVPGAFLTMLGTTLLNEIVALNENASPAFILERLRYRLIRALSQNNTNESGKDGMDISLLKFDVKSKSAEWAGAYNPIWIVRSNESPDLQTSGNYKLTQGDNAQLFEIKGDKIPVGIMDELRPFTDQLIQLNYGDIVYLLSDGFADQFGGDKGKKYRSGRLKDTILGLWTNPVEKHGDLLKKELEAWRGEADQIDDICVLGIEIIEARDENLS